MPRFALVGLAVILAIGWLSCLGPAGSFMWGPSTEQVVRIELGILRDAIASFRLDRHALPRTLADLERLTDRGGEPYLRAVPPDPWDRAFLFTIRDSERGLYELRSRGADGLVGTDDDAVERVEVETP